MSRYSDCEDYDWKPWLKGQAAGALQSAVRGRRGQQPLRDFSSRGRILVTVHRPGGATPHNLRAMAEQEARNLRAELAKAKREVKALRAELALFYGEPPDPEAHY
jgi:hypothetical protein